VSRDRVGQETMMHNNQQTDRGQVGIGTLIIFIALVLVAAVAAGVLINTAGFLQSSAESTGSEAQSQVSNQIDVISATGEVDENEDLVDKVNLVVKKSPGSDPIDLESATIQYTSSGQDVTLVYDSDAGEDNFETDSISGDDDTVLSGTSDRIGVTVDVSDIEDDGGLAGDQGATLRIVDESGATTVYGVNVPSPLGDRSVVNV
jgi:archaeal flagellin FlaB